MAITILKPSELDTPTVTAFRKQLGVEPLHLISGGEMSLSGLTLTINPLVFSKNDVQYTKNSQNFTLEAAHATLSRIDVAYLNFNNTTKTSTLEIMVGTPAINPIKWSVNPESQIELGSIFVLQENFGNSGAPGPTNFIDDITFEFRDVGDISPILYELDPKANYPYTILKVLLFTNTGTVTGMAVKINSTPVTSLSSITVTTSRTETAATAANVVALNDTVTLTGTGVAGGATTLVGKLTIQRNG